jgi:glycine/D-amino acid oxidase-like deaminating enzyme
MYGHANTIEVFPRPDGSTYVTGFSDTAGFPTDPADVELELNCMSMLQKVSQRLSPLFRSEKIIAKQACFRPRTADGLPLIGRVPGDDGLYVATGHGVWGILNAPATGEALAELIVEGTTRNIDLAPFDPGRLKPFDLPRLQAQ